MVIVLDDQLAEIPVGRPTAAPIPVAPVVEWVIGTSDEFRHTDDVVEVGEAELTGFIVSVPVALTVPHPPVSGIV